MRKIIKYLMLGLLSLVLLVVIAGVVKFNILQNDVYIENHNESTLKVSGKAQKVSPQSIRCFGKKTFHQFSDTDPGGYAVAISVIDISNPEKVEGYFRYHPYGTDSGVGSLQGTYNSDTGIIIADTVSSGEGMIYEGKKIWKIQDSLLISGYTQNEIADFEYKEDYADVSQVIWTEEKWADPEIDCAVAKGYMNDLFAQWDSYQQDKDVIRLQKALGDNEIIAANFDQVYVDLDGDWQTEEYLYFISSSSYCGSGGCTLVIVDKDGLLLHRFTVAKKPVYIANEPGAKGDWRDIVLWSDGSYRHIQYGLDGYPSNPSSAPRLTERDVVWHPENYFSVIR